MRGIERCVHWDNKIEINCKTGGWNRLVQVQRESGTSVMEIGEVMRVELPGLVAIAKTDAMNIA